MSMTVTRTNPILQLQETAIRRKMSAKISELAADVNKSHQTDPLTGILKQLCIDFKGELSTEYNPPEWEKRLIELLHSVLVDDLAQLPGEQLLLGSDECVYDRKSLSLYFDDVSEEYQTLSPLTGEPFFYIEEHIAANACVAWLKKYATFSESVEIVQAYEELESKGYIVPLPTKHNARARKKLYDQVIRLKAQEALIDEVTRKINAMETILLPEIKTQFAFLHEQMDETDRAILDRLEQLEEKDKQKAFELANQLVELDTQIQLFEASTAELSAQIDDITERTTAAEKDCLYLKKAVIDAQRAIAAAKKAKKQKILRAVIFNAANIGISYFTAGASLVTAFVQQAVKSTVSYTVSLLPISPALKTVFNSAIQSGLNAGFTGTNIVQGVIRGNAYGVASVGIQHIALKHTLVQGALHASVRGPLLIPGNTLQDTISNTVTGTFSAGISSQTGVPVSVTVQEKTLGITIDP